MKRPNQSPSLSGSFMRMALRAVITRAIATVSISFGSAGTFRSASW
jgi:hypothetical protein